MARRSEPRAARLEQLGRDLLLDHVLTLAQVQRRYRLSLVDVARAGVPHARQAVRVSKKSRRLLLVHFVAAEAGSLRLSEGAVRHLAGTAEIRSVLGSPTSGWSSSAWREAASMIPDAIWEHPRVGEVAVEYDSGGYTRQRIIDKAAAFSAYPLQVWGCASAQRAEHVRALTARVATNVLVLTAAAFDPAASTPPVSLGERLERELGGCVGDEA